MKPPSLGCTEPASSGCLSSDDFNYFSDNEMFGSGSVIPREGHDIGWNDDSEDPFRICLSLSPLCIIPRSDTVERYRILKLSSIGPLSLGLESLATKQIICRADSKPWKARGSYYTIRSNGNCLGKVRSNRMGSKYIFQDEGNSCPLLRIEYESRLSSNKDDLGPCRRFSATVFPRTSELVGKNSVANACEAFDIFSDSIVTPLRLSSLEPIKTIKGYVLDLNSGSSRSVVPSVKNFVLVNLMGARVLSMYKTGQGEYELVLEGGFLSPLHAFAIAISSIDKKLCTQ